MIRDPACRMVVNLPHAAAATTTSAPRRAGTNSGNSLRPVSARRPVKGSTATKAIHISGAGPAGLAAAITLAKGGAKVVVHERKAAVGNRFHGDFQGQENWSSPIDVTEELAEFGIDSDLPRAPLHGLTVYDAQGGEYRFDSEQPLFYLVRRGSGPDTFDAALLVHEGHATLASCFFADFHNERAHLAKSVAFFEHKLGFRLPGSAKQFGGLGNVSYPVTARKGNILYAGEAAGFQDALWGFGMRYAMISGALAARAWLAGTPEGYDRLWQQTLGGRMRAGIVNRWLFSRLGDRGYSGFLQRLAASGNARQWLMRYHQEHWHTRLLFPWANRMLPSRRAENRCTDSSCNCTWCRCCREGRNG